MAVAVGEGVVEADGTAPRVLLVAVAVAVIVAVVVPVILLLAVGLGVSVADCVGVADGLGKETKVTTSEHDTESVVSSCRVAVKLTSNDSRGSTQEVLVA